LTSLLWWVLSVAGVVACMRWFARQPYSIAEPILKGLAFNHSVLVFQIIYFLIQLLGATLCLALLAFPILVAWLPEMRSLNRTALLRIAGITLAWGLIQWKTKWTMPWLPPVIQREFAAARTDVYLRTAPIILPMWAREAFSLLVVAAAVVLIEQLLAKRTAQVAPRQDIGWLLGPFSLSYFLLLQLTAETTRAVIADRYLLPIMPIAIICLLKLYQQWIATCLPDVSVAVLAVFALLAIGGTHDWFAWQRARVTAINEIRASGVPRTSIQGGFEFDGWTQVEDRGSIDGSLFFKEDWHRVIPECKFRFASYTPAIHPKFTTVFPKMGCLAPSIYPSVTYRTWLPPYNSRIYVQEIPDALTSRSIPK
jgi:hypothetical protein